MTTPMLDSGSVDRAFIGVGSGTLVLAVAMVQPKAPNLALWKANSYSCRSNRQPPYVSATYMENNNISPPKNDVDPLSTTIVNARYD